MVITRSVTVTPGTWRLRAPADPDSALIVVRGDDLTIDFAGATLVGAPESGDPDRAAGVAIRIDGGRHVTIRGAHIRGYKIAILARGTRDLRLLDNDLSYNWKPRLYSGVEHESLVDWLTFHHNESDEWLRYGAAIYLAGVRGGEIRHNRADQGMNALLLARTDSVRIWNNTFSFVSGLGIGLYRSNDNTILHNRIDYAVRGYSHGFYRRGQDSAGILVYEQSCRNIVAWNSATHGGDGFFLWAGQQTMDTGMGGANDNVLYENDFSHAAANGIEVTFSRNVIMNNRLEENDYGVWGGYSFESVIAGNRFARNHTGIAIEHGQDNVIARNQFNGDSTAVRLWGNPIEPGDWGYPKHRDTRSRDYLLDANRVRGAHVGVRASDTRRLVLAANDIEADSSLVLSGDTAGFAFNPPGRPIVTAELQQALARVPRPLAGGMHAMLPVSARRGRATIIVDDWGPYDWRSPKLWPAARADARPLSLRVLGPAGRWRVVGRTGIAALSDMTGRVPGTITVTPVDSVFEDWTLELEYRGAATVSPRGVRAPAGAPVRVTYAATAPHTRWHQRIVTWADSTDPRTPTDAFATALRQPPTLERDTPTLDYQWYRPQVTGIPLERWGLRATTTLDLPAGTWQLLAISDDGVRVWVDEQLVIDAWAPHESRVDRARIEPGRHSVRVEYYQVDGWTELRVDVVRAP